jgi:hypothetical protein
MDILPIFGRPQGRKVKQTGERTERIQEHLSSCRTLSLIIIQFIPQGE